MAKQYQPWLGPDRLGHVVLKAATEEKILEDLKLLESRIQVKFLNGRY